MFNIINIKFKGITIGLITALALTSISLYSCTKDDPEVISTTESTSKAGNGEKEEVYNIVPVSPIEVKAGEDTPVPCIIKTTYPTSDVVVADIIATDKAYGADPTGVEDSTKAIRKAINACARAGGGTVWLPAGSYRITDSIEVYPFVTLRGDWQDPDSGNEYGTVIIADMEAQPSDETGLFIIGGSAGVRGLTVFYPNQSLSDVKEYPYTFYIPGDSFGGDYYMLQSVMECTVLNGYKGLGATVVSGCHEMLTVDTLKGTFLSSGAVAYNQADVGTWKNVYISPSYWANAGEKYNAPDTDVLRSYTRSNTKGIIAGDLEWTQFLNLNISDCSIAFEVVKGRRIEFAGSIYNATIKDCDIGFNVTSIDTRWGMLVGGSDISATGSAIVNPTAGLVKVSNANISGSLDGKNISVSDITADIPEIDSYKSPAKPREALYIATEYGVNSKGKEDCSARLQAVLDTAGRDGGGVVYLPSGYYRLDRAVTVPAGVALRGSSSVATRDQGGSSLGTVILAYYGKNPENEYSQQALITLDGDFAGISGLRFIYPENNPAQSAEAIPYTFTVRGTPGSKGVYAVNIGFCASYAGIDFTSCDNHFIKKVIGGFYYYGIVAGGKDGHIEGCLENSTAVIRIGMSMFPEFNGWVGGDKGFTHIIDPITRKHLSYITLENAENEVILNSFAYGCSEFISALDSTGYAVNIGADNIASDSSLLYSAGKDTKLTVFNMMRYNGSSYTLFNGAKNSLYNRITINDKSEEDIQAD